MKNILSTKILTSAQRALLNENGLNVVEYDAITVKSLEFKVPNHIENAIFTSQNAVKSFFGNTNTPKNNIEWCFCVGERTKLLLEENGQKVIKMATNASKLAQYIIKKHQNEPFFFFCGNLRRDEIPSELKKAKIDIFEVKVYETELNLKNFDQKWNEILFFSPSGVQSFIAETKIEKGRAI
jgi:uroporphyrinogen-III synthase